MYMSMRPIVSELVHSISESILPYAQQCEDYGSNKVLLWLKGLKDKDQLMAQTVYHKAQVASFVKEGKLKVHIDQVFGLEDIVTRHK